MSNIYPQQEENKCKILRVGPLEQVGRMRNKKSVPLIDDHRVEIFRKPKKTADDRFILSELKNYVSERIEKKTGQLECLADMTNSESDFRGILVKE
jgi:hypothetical protein